MKTSHFDKNFAIELREQGLSNEQIGLRMGYNRVTVIAHIGKQPTFMTKANRNLGIKQSFERRAQVKKNSVIMKRVANINMSIKSLEEERNKLLGKDA